MAEKDRMILERLHQIRKAAREIKDICESDSPPALECCDCPLDLAEEACSKIYELVSIRIIPEEI